MKRDNPFKATPSFLAAITVLAIALRVIRLDFQPLWWDEGYSVFFATRDFSSMLARTAVDIHPPLYYAVLQIWMLLAGKSDIALRLLSVGIGVAVVPIAYPVGRLLFNSRIGIIGAFLLAISPFQVYYSQEVRMYSLVAFLALVSIALQLSLLSRNPAFLIPGAASGHRGESGDTIAAANATHGHVLSIQIREAALWVCYVLVTAAALYCQYYFAFVLGAEIVVVWFWNNMRRQGRREGEDLNSGSGPRTPSLRSPPSAKPNQDLSGQRTRIRPWIFAWTVVLVLYLPWLIYAAPKLLVYVTAKVDIEQYSRLDPITFLAQHLAAFSVGHPTSFSWLVLSTPIFVALIVAGVFYAFRHPVKFGSSGRNNTDIAVKQNPIQSAQIISVYLLVPLFCGWLVSLIYTFHPIRYERLLLLASPPFYVLIAVGLDSLLHNRRPWAYAAIAAIVLTSVASLYDFYTVPRYPDEDYRPLIRDMQLMARRDDVVLAPYPWQIGYLETYYSGPPQRIVEVPSDQWISQPTRMESALNSIRSSIPRAWLLAYQTKGRVLEDQIANYFADDYVFADEWSGNTRLEYFAQGPDPTLNQQVLEFRPELKLDSYGVGDEPVTSGAGFIRVRLHWEATSNAYSYSLRLLDRSGVKQVQQDEAIATGNEIERRGVFVPKQVGSGEFDLLMVVYLRADGSALPLPDGSREIRLAHILVNSQ